MPAEEQNMPLFVQKDKQKFSHINKQICTTRAWTRLHFNSGATTKLSFTSKWFPQALPAIITALHFRYSHQYEFTATYYNDCRIVYYSYGVRNQTTGNFNIVGQYTEGMFYGETDHSLLNWHWRGRPALWIFFKNRRINWNIQQINIKTFSFICICNVK